MTYYIYTLFLSLFCQILNGISTNYKNKLNRSQHDWNHGKDMNNTWSMVDGTIKLAHPENIGVATRMRSIYHSSWDSDELKSEIMAIIADYTTSRITRHEWSSSTSNEKIPSSWCFSLNPTMGVAIGCIQYRHPHKPVLVQPLWVITLTGITHYASTRYSSYWTSRR